jgi:hypothetical protein
MTNSEPQGAGDDLDDLAEGDVVEGLTIISWP